MIKKKVLVIGAGWYGCHIGLTLLRHGHNVEIQDKKEAPFLGASGLNQNRLHMGFHYPRCSETRFQSLGGFNWFLSKYEFLTKKVDQNFYAIADKGSVIDFVTFKQIMTASELNYTEVDPSETTLKLEGCSKFIQVDERLICSLKTSKYFLSELKDNIRFDKFVDIQNTKNLRHLKKEYDFIIDCSWGTAQSNINNKVFYEPCIYFKSKFVGKDAFALTLMDGPFFSIYPEQNNHYTITSVEDTPLTQCEDYNTAEKVLKSSNNSAFVEQKYHLFRKKIEFFYPSFSKYFKNPSPMFSIKTKKNSSVDNRASKITICDNVISVFSGKIDTIYIAERKILDLLS